MTMSRHRIIIIKYGRALRLVTILCDTVTQIKSDERESSTEKLGIKMGMKYCTHMKFLSDKCPNSG